MIENGIAALEPKPAAPATTFRIVWQGAQRAVHSLALVNRAICTRLIGRGHELSLVAPTNQELEHATLELEPALATCLSKKLSGPADFHISHQWPPDFRRPREGRWIII